MPSLHTERVDHEMSLVPRMLHEHLVGSGLIADEGLQSMPMGSNSTKTSGPKRECEQWPRALWDGNLEVGRVQDS